MRQQEKQNKRPTTNTREFFFEGIREIKEGERKFELSFSSEEPVSTYWGKEVLDHSEGCVDLQRMNGMACLLFNHNRDRVVGKIARAWLEEGRTKAEVEFDTDQDSETIYQKVKNGTLRGVSVGYRVMNWEDLKVGETSADGRFEGPVSIAKRWMPYEISIVSIPADATVGVGREFDAGAEEAPQSSDEKSFDFYERQLTINKNKFGGK